MKNGAFVVFKKEMARFFGDKRLFFTTVILPGLLIFLMYTLMGNTMSGIIKESNDKNYNTYIVNLPVTIEAVLEDKGFDVTEISLSETEGVKDKIRDKDADLLVVFPEGFDESVASFGESGREIPNVEIYYNSSDIGSSAAYSRMESLLDLVEERISNVFDINMTDSDGDAGKYDVATDEDTTGSLFASILPMILLVMMYSSCMAIAPESIAGEKERGTFATMLITPVPRGQIAFGKVLALSVMALLGGISSCLGTMLSMPALVGDMMDSDGTSAVSFAVYSAADYLWLVIIILSTVILFVTVISILSTYAKTVKEASTLALPVMIIVMFAGFSSIYSTEPKEELFWYFVPVLNSVQCLIGIFARSTSTVRIAAAAGTNIAASALGMLLLRKMFNSEKIMFAK